MRMVAFLRGINVGNRRPKKDELILAVTGPEFADVTTFQTSGNLIFDTAMAPPDIEPVLEQRLHDALGYNVTCFVRTIDHLRSLLDEMPSAGPDEKHQVIFYRSDPGDDAHAALATTAGPNDTIRRQCVSARVIR